MSRAALAASRSIAILDFLAAHPAEGFTLSELARRLEINVSSAHGLLNVLTEAGYIERHHRLRTYTLGPAVVAVGGAAREHHPAVELACTAAHDLAEEIGLEVTVTSVAGDDIVFLARAGEHRAPGITGHVGQRVPFAPPLGTVFIAWTGPDVTDDRTARWLARSDDPQSMRAVLDGIRARGYAIGLEADSRRALGRALEDLTRETSRVPSRAPTLDALVAELGHSEYQVRELEDSRTYDVSFVAAPVFGPGGEVVLALTLVGFAPELPAARIAAYGEQLRDVGLVITQRSHGRAPQLPVGS
jgi:DNA-binding IclR family transcriptional regulator